LAFARAECIGSEGKVPKQPISEAKAMEFESIDALGIWLPSERAPKGFGSVVVFSGKLKPVLKTL
jgi:hypothetical protein